MCSQLSSTSRVAGRAAMASLTTSRSSRSAWPGIDSTSAMARTSWAGSVRGASSTSHTPPGKPDNRAGCHLQRQPSLAGPADPNECHQAAPLYRGVHVGLEGVAPDERGERSREVMSGVGWGLGRAGRCRPGRCVPRGPAVAVRARGRARRRGDAGTAGRSAALPALRPESAKAIINAAHAIRHDRPGPVGAGQLRGPIRHCHRPLHRQHHCLGCSAEMNVTPR